MNLIRCLGAVAASLLLAGHAAAQYPGRPVRVIVPFPAGGGTDIVARTIAQPLSQALGQPVMVDNKPGAEGQIAATEVRRAAPDGHTLLFAGPGALLMIPLLRKSPPYEPTDFTPISFAVRVPFFLFVHASVPARSLDELIGYARANPGKLSYGLGGSGTHVVATAQLLLYTRTDMVQIPYKGEAQAVPDFVAGRVQVMVATPTLTLPPVKEGKLRTLAAIRAERNPMLPEVPTMAELGYREVSATPWLAFFGPAQLPKEITARLSREIDAILKRPDVREQLDKHAFEPAGSTPEALREFLNTELEAWRAMVREAKIPQE